MPDNLLDTLPEVAKAYIVADLERETLTVAKRNYNKSKEEAVEPEKQAIKSVEEGIAGALDLYLTHGKDTRQTILELRGQLPSLKKALKDAREPWNQKIKPISDAIGEKIETKTKLAPEISGYAYGEYPVDIPEPTKD